MVRGIRRARLTIVVVVAAVLAAACALDADGVLRPAAEDAIESVDVARAEQTGECAELLATVQTSALAVVGPDGLPDPSPFDGFNDFRQVVLIDRAAFDGWDDGTGEATTILEGTDAVVVGERVVIVRDGWLHVLDGEADAPVHSSWLGSVSVGHDPVLIAEGDGLLVIHETSAIVGDHAGPAVRLARISFDGDGVPDVQESVEILGELAGADLGAEELEIAVRRGAPSLDLVRATTAGAEAAAIEVNRAAIAATTIDDWVPIVRHTDGDGETTESLVGGCDVVMPPGSETALGATALLRVETGAPLAGIAGQLVLGDGVVVFDDDHAWLLSSRNSVVDFGAADALGGIGADRVVAIRLTAGDDGYVAEAAGIVAGRLTTPSGLAMGDEELLLFTSQDQWGNQLTLTSLGGSTELAHLDSHEMNLDWWGVLNASVIDDDTVMLSRQNASALIDLSDPDDLQVETVQTRWNQGVRVAAEQLFPFGDDRYLASSGGQIVSDWGSVEIFFQQVVNNEFGGAPRLEDWFGQPGQVSLSVREGGTDDTDETVSWIGEAFGLWIVAADPVDDTVLVGVAGLRDPDDPPILGGELFTGGVLLAVEGGEFVERDRVTFTPTRPDDIGATDCERARVDQFFLDVAGLWNAQIFSCEAGVGAGVVGYSCFGMGLGEIEADVLAWQWGITDTSAIEADFAALQAVVDAGGTNIACRAKAPVTVDAPLAQLPTDDGDLWLTTTTGVVRYEEGVAEIAVLALEPPYGD